MSVYLLLYSCGVCKRVLSYFDRHENAFMRQSFMEDLLFVERARIGWCNCLVKRRTKKGAKKKAKRSVRKKGTRPKKKQMPAVQPPAEMVTPVPSTPEVPTPVEPVAPPSDSTSESMPSESGESGTGPG